MDGINFNGFTIVLKQRFYTGQRGEGRQYIFF